MIAYKCKNCGGQLEFSGAGGFVCPYCGSRSFFSDREFQGNEIFRRKLLQYARAEADRKELDADTDPLWSCEGTDSFSMEDGQALQIEYMQKDRRDGYVCYLAKESVVFVFERGREAEAYLAGLSRMVFPAADVRLHRSFPELKLELGLEGGGRVLVFRRRPGFYPAQLLAPWASEHLAWVISRMENICCALEYAGLEHGDISPASVWVDPIRHQGALFGDWRRIRSLRGRGDLIALRKTAIALAENTREPAALYKFLNSPPAADAYADFESWDQVIEKGFGGHKFIKMSF